MTSSPSSATSSRFERSPHRADINATYRDLAAKGEFTTPPKQEMWGWCAQFKDPDGNEFGLGQDCNP
jgi:predicted enzyme related to lactoylglutathione lyase